MKRKNFRKNRINCAGLCVLLLCGMILCWGCSIAAPSEENRPLRIVTTIYAPYDFATSVCGDLATVTMLLQPGEDVHSFEPTPQDIIAIEKCDVFIYAGGENDVWVDTILESSGNSSMKVIKMTELVPLYEEDEGDVLGGGTNEETGDGEDEEWDEHVWTDPQNAIRISEEIADCCKEVLQDKNMMAQTDAIQNRCEAYCRQLAQLNRDFHDVIDDAPRKMVVFADRFPLRYFVEAYDLRYVAAFPGCSSEAEPSAKKVAAMIDLIREKNIPVVFKIELSNDHMAKVIAEECGVKIITFYSCHNISRKDYEAGENYISLMKKNLEALKEALY